MCRSVQVEQVLPVVLNWVIHIPMYMIPLDKVVESHMYMIPLDKVVESHRSFHLYADLL